jgi:FdhD protein
MADVNRRGNIRPAAAPVRAVPVAAVRSNGLQHVEDHVAVEEPLEIRLAAAGEAGSGRAVSVTMRTPGHDTELALGFLHGEGLVGCREDVAEARPCGPSGNVVRVELAAHVEADVRRLERNFYTSSSCGVCGKASIEAVRALLPTRAVDSPLRVTSRLLGTLAETARVAQGIFDKTGGLHAASLFDASGVLDASFEDVGRHNALDKLVGAALLAGSLPLSGSVLLLSGRASFELLQKAIMAGIPVVAALGAPSSLAVDLAQENGVLLVGFLRGETFNVYSHPDRLL